MEIQQVIDAVLFYGMTIIVVGMSYQVLSAHNPVFEVMGKSLFVLGIVAGYWYNLVFRSVLYSFGEWRAKRDDPENP